MANPNLWTLAQLDAIERTYPSKEVKALVAEIRRLNVIATRAGDVVTHVTPSILAAMPSFAKYAVLGMREVLEGPVSGKPRRGAADD